MASLTRVAALATRAWQSQGITASGRAWMQNAQQTRSMGGSAQEFHDVLRNSVTYGRLVIFKPPAWEYAASKLVGGLMWFWIFAQAYHFWDHKTKGLPAIFEAEGLDDDDDHNAHH